MPNPSFEDTVQANGGPGVKGWENNIGSPDYFTPYYPHGLSGFWTPVNVRGAENPKDGVAYFGFTALDMGGINRREYLQTKLTQTLIEGKKYEIEFYISLADSFHWALNEKDIGVYIGYILEPNNFDHKVREFRPFFTSDSVWNASNKSGWEKFHYTYTALGGESTIAIGCFKIDSNLTLDNVGNGGHFPWAYDGSYYYVDNIRVELKDTNTSITKTTLQQQIQWYPNPAAEQLNLVYSGKETLNFQWYNLKGQLLNVKVQKRGNRYRFQTATLPQGIYFLQLSDGIRQSSLKVVKE